MSSAITIAAVGLGVSAWSASNSAKNQKKSLEQQQSAIDANDPAALAQLAHDQAIQNAFDSRALEEQLSPEVVALRQSANTRLLDYTNSGEDSGLQRSRQLLEQNLGVPVNSPLLNAAIAKAQADLGLGGRLGADAQNAATRGAAARAGQVGGGLGLGRDLTARDLGLSSANLEQQRLMNASQLGGQELNRESLNSSNLLNSINALSSLHNNRYNQLLSTAQYGNSIRSPLVGLDPGSAASAYTANNNAQAQLATNSANANTAQWNTYANLAGQGLSAWQQYQQNQTYLNSLPYNSTVTVGNATSPYAMNVTYVPPTG